MPHPKEEKLLAIAEGLIGQAREDGEELPPETQEEIRVFMRKVLPLWNQLMPIIVADILKVVKHGKGPEDGF